MMTTNPDELALLDSNVLVYSEQEEQPHHEAAQSLRDRALTGELAACISPQVLNEFFAVSTNPRRVSAPLTTQEAIDQVRMYYRSRRLVKIYPGPTIIEQELTLLDTYPVTGPNIHDLHLVATMLENGIHKIYTFNAKHFAPFSEIEVLTPPEPESIQA